MLAGLIITLVVAAIAIIVAGIAVGQRLAWRSIERRHAVVVLPDTETTFEGVLWERRGPLVVLRGVTVYTGARAEGTPVDGDVVIERARIGWMQVTK